MMNLSMNEYTTKQWAFEDDVRYYSLAGYKGIGIVREKIENHDLGTVLRLIKSHDLIISELCSIGNLVSKDLETQRYYIEEGVHAIQIANKLEARSLIVLAGFEPSFDYAQSMSALRYSIDALLPVAESNNVRLALEPLHPMYKSSLSFMVSLSETLDFIEEFGSKHLGVWLDTQHIWWDKNVFENIARAGNRIFGVHINDWLLNPQSLYDWGLPGKGVIPLGKMMSAISSTGWSELYSVEVISEKRDSSEYIEILDYCIEWFKHMTL